MATAAEIVTSIRLDSSSLAADAAGVRGIFASLRQDIDRALSVSLDLGKLKFDTTAIAGIQQQLANLKSSLPGGNIPLTLTPQINQQQLQRMLAGIPRTIPLNYATPQIPGAGVPQPPGAAGVIAQAQANAQRQPGVPGGNLFALNRVSQTARNFLLATGAGVALAAREYAKAEDADNKFRAALEATGAEVENNTKEYRAFAQSIRNVTTLSDEQVKSLGTLALNLGVSADNIQQVVKAGIGLGQSLFGGNFEQGVKAAALAVQGQVGRLRSLIPALRDAKTEEEALRIVNAKAAAGFREAQADVNTFGGSMRVLKRDIQDAAQALGQAFAPDIQAAGEHVRNVANNIRDMNEEQRRGLAHLTELSGGFAGLTYAGAKTTLTLAALSKATGLSATGILGTVGVVGLLGAAFVNLVGKGDTFLERFEDVWERASESVRKAFAKIVPYIDEFENRAVRFGFRLQEVFKSIEKGTFTPDFAAAERAFEDYQQGVKNKDEQAKKDKEARDKGAATAEVNANAQAQDKIKSQYSSLKDYYTRVQRAILDTAQRNATVTAAANAKAQQTPATRPTPATQPAQATTEAPAPTAPRGVAMTPPIPGMGSARGTPAARVVAAAREQRDVRAESEERRQQMQADLDALRDLEALEQRTPSFRDNAVHERLKKKLRDRIVENRRFIEGEGDVQKAISGEVAERDRAAARQTTRPMEDAKRRIELMRKNLDDEAKALEAGGGFVSEESGRVVNRAGRIDTKAFRTYAGKLLDEYTNQQLRAAREEEERIRASVEQKIQDRAQPNRVRVRQGLERALPSIGSAVNTVLNLTSTPTAPLALRNPQQQPSQPAQQETMQKFSDGTDKLSKAADGMQDAADDIKSVFKSKQQIYVVEES
jgi:hypothetical protein